jgi:hypothetical protein
MDDEVIRDNTHAFASIPTDGFLTVEQAASMFGISRTTWQLLEQSGKVTCGKWVANANGGGRHKLYPIRPLRQLLAQMTFPPPGTLTCDDAARMFGVAKRTWSSWQKEGRITCGRLVSVHGRPGQQKVYPLDELHRLLEKFKQKASRPFPPEGFVTREGACRIFGVRMRTWTRWESEGRITCGTFTSIPNKPGRCKLYQIEELEELKRQFDRLEETRKPYPDPQRPGCWRVPLTSDVHQMEAIIDEESLPLVEGRRWWWSPGRTNGSNGCVVLGINGTPKPPLRQIIMGVRGTKQRVAHLNGDLLDCRRQNLVIRTPSEQKAASRKMKSRGGRPLSSQFKGVTWEREGRKWSASIKADEVFRPLGRFLSEIDAALAYDAAAQELFGSHARLNFADPNEAERLRVTQLLDAPPDGPFPPRGMVEVENAARMLDVPVNTWLAWEQMGRLPVRCKDFERPDGGRCALYAVEELNRAQDQIRTLYEPYPDPQRAGCYRLPVRSFLTYREALIDIESLPHVRGRHWNWHARTEGVCAGQVVLATSGGPCTPLARIITGVADLGPERRVGHRNDDPLDCRRENLIVRTGQEERFGNRKMGSVSGRQYTSKFKGVCWEKRRETWVAHLQKDGKHHFLGSFHDEIAAAQAYDEAALQFFGEHARVNFPDGIDVWLDLKSSANVQQTRAA